jgi:thiamine pyrophosphate-dependent acetolactate synthase large subunit-like protein
MQSQQPHRILVLGTRLDEPTYFWNPLMIPSSGFIHIDIDPEVLRLFVYVVMERSQSSYSKEQSAHLQLNIGVNLS